MALCSAAVALCRPADKVALQLLWTETGLPLQERVAYVLNVFGVHVRAVDTVRPETQVRSKIKNKETNKMGEKRARSHNEEKSSASLKVPTKCPFLPLVNIWH